VRVGAGGAEPLNPRRRPMDAVKILNRSRQGPPGVWGVERSDSDGGNWGGPPRPDDLRCLSSERRTL